MQKQFLALMLALALCLAPATALAAEAGAGDTTIVDANGVTYQLSKPIVRVDTIPEDIRPEDVRWEDPPVKTPVSIVYVVPAGTQIIPISGPAGYTRHDRDSDNYWIEFKNAEGNSIDISTETLCQGLGGSDDSGITLDRYDSDESTRYHGFMSRHFLGSTETEVHTIFTCAEPEDGPAVPGFSDVKPGDWYYDAVQWAVEKNITVGTSDTTFSPGATCTTGQILTFLWRASGSPEPAISNPFTDIQPSGFYYKAALWAAEKGIVSGTAFGANTDCTRSSTVEYMWKAAGSPAASYDGRFTDVAASADDAQAVAWTLENDVTAGTSAATFSPNDTCTRGQIVTFLHRAFAQ